MIKGELEIDGRLKDSDEHDALPYTSVQLRHTFTLPPGYTRELGRYEQGNAVAYLSWESVEGGRYVITAEHALDDTPNCYGAECVAAVSVIAQEVYEGTIAPVRIVRREQVSYKDVEPE